MNEDTNCFEVLNGKTGEAAQLDLQSLWLTGRITPSGARLVVVHHFRSSESTPIEAVYAFGLPRDAALRRFRIEGDGFRAHSELRSTEEAWKEYERGIQQGSLSALAQTYRDGRVNLSVGNLRPGEAVRVFLELVAGVDLRDNGLRFRFPFTLAPCYHRQARCVESAPGVGEIELPADQFGDLLLPPFLRDASALHAVSFDLSVGGTGKVLSIASPSHPVKVTSLGAQGARVGLGVFKDVPDRDLVMDVETEPGSVTVDGGGLAGGEARFNVTLPSTCFDKQESGPRQVVFILDRSGSMDGTPLEQARQAAAACLATLSDEDQFGLLVFDDSTEVFKPQLVSATLAHRKAGLRFLDSVQARGGTQLGPALEAGLRLARGHDSAIDVQADLFVLTDGQVSATEEILSQIRAARSRVHCLGIGAASQDRFLTLLSRTTGGVCRFLTPRERVDLGALDLFASVKRPAVSDLRVSFSGLQGATTVVAAPSTVFDGLPLVIMAKAASLGRGALQLAWAGGTKTRRVELALENSPTAETVRLLQGARVITDLDATLDGEIGTPAETQGREAKRWREKLENLSREYGLASRAMSLVAVVERAGDDASRVPTTRVVPVGLAQDVAFDSYVGWSQPRTFHMGGTPQIMAKCAIQAGPVGGKYRRQPTLGRKGLIQDLWCKLTSDPGPAGDDIEESTEPSQQDLEDLLVQKFGTSHDGGLAGPSEDLRLLRSLAALLILGLLGHGTHAGPFRVLCTRLIAFVRPRLALIPADDVRRTLSQLVDAVEDGQIPSRWQTREHAEALALELEATQVDWKETAQRWSKFLP